MKNNTKVSKETKSKNIIDEKIKTFFNNVEKNKSDNDAFIRWSNK